MARSEIFWNLMAKKYSEQSIADEKAYQLKLKMTQDYCNPETSLLEFGCGTGSTALFHAPNVKKVVAIDYSKKMVEIAQQKLQGRDLKNVEFIKTTLFDLPSKSEEYDVILGLNILHLMKNCDDAILKTFDLLKPGGVFITSTVCMRENSSLENYILPIGSALRLIPYIKRLDFETLNNSLTNAGYNILEFLTPGKEKYVAFIIAQKG